MKNICSVIILAVMLLSGCVQEEISDNDSYCDGRQFTAAFEQAETRTYVEDDVLLRWTAGDQISLFDGNTLNRQYQFDGETGDNSGVFFPVNNPYGTGNDLTANYAVYPYSSDMKITEGGVVTLTLPSEQSYAEDSFGLGANTMVAVTKGTNDTFLRFRNICGYLKLQLYGEDVTVKSVKLAGNSDEKITGKVAVTTAYAQEPVISISGESAETITLDCGEGVKIGSTAETATAFWIVVPPLTFEDGFTITVEDTDGGTFVKSTSNEIQISRNVIKPMKAFEVEIEKIPNNQIWYTSSDGNIVTPYETGVFGADIVSNVYENGKGIITFDGDVTKVGNRAFNNRYYLTSIVIPNSVTAIEDYALSSCSNLTSVTIPESVITIGDGAFSACYSLASIIIPAGVTTIESGAFESCQSLTTVTIPDSVIEIGNWVFAGCYNLKEFKGKFASDGGRCLINDNAIIAYANGSGTEYTIPDNVTTVWSGTFVGSPLTEITVPDNVRTIQPSSFFCPNLKTINGKYATADGRFYIIDGAVKLFAPAGLTECVIPDGVTNIEYRTFISAPFTSLTIPESVTEISYYALQNCYNLTSIYCKVTTPPTAVFNYNTWSAFSGNANMTIYVPVDSVLEYRKAAGWDDYAERIVAYDYDKGEEVISGNIIYYTSSDGKIVEPFRDDYFGAEIISNTYENGRGAIVFDKDVIRIGLDAFKNCSRLTSITIPDSVVEIETGAFYGCYHLQEFKGRYASYDGNCLVVDGMLAAYAEASGTEYTIPDNVTVIGPHVFDGFSDLSHIDIPDGVTTISYGAFQSCSSLTSILIPDSVTEIGDQAFLWCFDLTKVTMSNSLKRIGGFAFCSCPIKNISIPKSVETIGRGAFQYCSDLSVVTIGNGVKEILYEAFDGCYSLTNVTIPDSVTEIGNNAFSNCTSLVSVYCKPDFPPISCYWAGEHTWEAFDNNGSGRRIYVPRASVNAYKSADGWSNYASDIVEYDF